MEHQCPILPWASLLWSTIAAILHGWISVSIADLGLIVHVLLKFVQGQVVSIIIPFCFFSGSAGGCQCLIGGMFVHCRSAPIYGFGLSTPSLHGTAKTQQLARIGSRSSQRSKGYNTLRNAWAGWAPRTLWPSGLRRWLKAPFRKGVGSNPTGVTLHVQVWVSVAHQIISVFAPLDQLAGM